MYIYTPSPKDSFTDFKERGKEREKKKINVRKKHKLVSSLVHPDQGLNLQPRYMP